MKCIYCGHENPNIATQCKKCKAALRPVEPPKVEPTPVEPPKPAPKRKKKEK